MIMDKEDRYLHLLGEWKVLAEQVEQISRTLATTLDYTSYQDYQKALKLQQETIDKLNSLWSETSNYILMHFYDRWGENGELK